MEIVYILTVLWLLVTSMLIKKSEEKQNFLFRLILTIVIFTAYNVFVAFVFLIFHIEYSLLALSLVNAIVSGILTFVLYKKKSFQKYFVKKTDIVFLVILLIIVSVLAIKQYGGVKNIKYETTDPAIHFNWAKEFYNNKTLEWGGMMPGAYVNTEILFDTFDFVIGEESFYYLYIIFDLIMLYLMGAILYLGVTSKIKSIKKSIIAMFFTVIFLYGFPLNSMLFGYAYLSLGMLYMVTILAVGIYAINDELKLLSACVEMFFLTFGLFFSYYFFVPVVFIALGLYLLIDMLKKRKNKNVLSVFTKNNIIKMSIMLILPAIIGFCYFVLPGLLKTGQTMVGHIATEGYIYRDLFSNFVLLAPLAIFYVLYNLKNKQNSLSTILSIISVLFTVFLLKKGLKGEVSSYYYFKMYFLLWILVFYMNIKALFIMIDSKNETYAYSFLTVFVALLAIAYTGVDYKVSEINLLFNPTNSISSFTNIYLFNKNKIYSDNYIYSEKQIEAIKKVINISNNKENILINGEPMQMLWANSVWNLTDTTDVRELQIPKEFNIDDFLNNDKKKYFIYFDTSKEIEKETEKYKTIYDTKDAVILEKITQ